jgi:hypothetical protein
VIVSRLGFETSKGGVAVVAWRDGARVGVIWLHGHRRRAAEDALGLARFADTWLRTPPPATAWERIADQIHPDGSVSEKTALLRPGRREYAVAWRLCAQTRGLGRRQPEIVPVLPRRRTCFVVAAIVGADVDDASQIVPNRSSPDA